jgi:glutaconate CoA-transferase subunit B
MTTVTDYTPEEMMAIVAARRFRDGATCFVGVGLPSTAGCLARALHAPDATLVYESGAIGSKPKVIPLSIADPELADTAVVIASVNEIFAYWLQGGRIDLGVLGAAQIDRFGNVNSTVIGDYVSPRVRLPGAGGAPHIAANAREIVIIVRQDLKTFVSRLDFITTPHCSGPTMVITDLGVLEAEPETGELVLTCRYPGVTLEQIRQATGWPLRFAGQIDEVPAPEGRELRVLRDLNERTRRAHEAV